MNKDPKRAAQMTISEATSSYESWMGRHIQLVSHQLLEKHAGMKKDLFTFFRGTFYRWLQLWQLAVPRGIQTAPHVLGVGDLHVDSFGTWRDVEGRLAWGIDDFDEAFHLPYTNDLVRLAASVRIVAKMGALEIPLRKACETILDGYRSTLRHGGAPVTLAEEELILENLGIKELTRPEDFWQKLIRLPPCHRDCPAGAREALENALPKSICYKLVSRTAGTGSLGHPRFVAIAEWKGGFIAREAKAMGPPASAWIGNNRRGKSYYNQVIESAFRSHDPFQKVINGWLIRRLSPASNPISITDWPRKRDEITLLRSMGRETANVHLGSGNHVKSILHHLDGADATWLYEAAKRMVKAIVKDWKEYRR
jgi:Uncharacterized protein conserved in bacteria (DUF2252)